MPFSAALVGVCATVLLLCVTWLMTASTLVVTTYVVRELAPASRTARTLVRTSERSCPKALRRLVVGVLGVAVTAGVATGPALADPAAHQRLTGLLLPDRTTGATMTATAPRTVLARTPAGSPDRSPNQSPDRTIPRRVRVLPGDSLWSIAAALLPPGATDADVSRAWHRLHHANALRIGTDPDLILPGTRLMVPDLSPSPREEPR